MRFRGISEQSLNIMSFFPDPGTSHVPSFKLPSKCWFVITSNLLNKEEISLMSLKKNLEKLAKVSTHNVNHLHLIELFLHHLFGLNLLLWKILYHGLDRTNHWLMTVISKTFLFKRSSTRYLLFLPASTNFIITAVIKES